MSDPSSSVSVVTASSGALALIHTGRHLPLQVLRSAAGYYIGTYDDGPVTRESVAYFPTHSSAQQALDTGAWTQRDHV